MKREEEGEGCVMEGGVEEEKKRGRMERREEERKRARAGEDKRMVNDRTRRWRRGERGREGARESVTDPSFPRSVSRRKRGERRVSPPSQFE